MNQQQFFWASNLKFLRQRKKCSQDAVSAELGITRAKLAAHETGHSRNPPIEDLVRFSDYYRISIDTLVKKDLSKMSELKVRELEAGNDPYATGTNIRVLATTVDGENNDNAELVPVKARAGYTAGYGDAEYISRLPRFSLPQLSRDRKYRMFPTSGDSMLPVPEGAFVIGEYAEDWTGLKDGTPCIVVTRQEGIVFKLVHRVKERQALRLTSLNEAYAPYEVPLGDVLEVWRFKSFLSDTLPRPEVPVQQIARAVQDMHADLKVLMKRK